MKDLLRILALILSVAMVAFAGCGGSDSGPFDQTGPDVYAGGYSTDNSGLIVAGYWKNGTWNGLTPPDPTWYSRVYSLAVSGSDVYAGGVCIDGSGISVPGYWKNGEWNGLSRA